MCTSFVPRPVFARKILLSWPVSYDQLASIYTLSGPSADVTALMPRSLTRLRKRFFFLFLFEIDLPSRRIPEVPCRLTLVNIFHVVPRQNKSECSASKLSSLTNMPSRFFFLSLVRSRQPTASRFRICQQNGNDASHVRLAEGSSKERMTWCLRRKLLTE